MHVAAEKVTLCVRGNRSEQLKHRTGGAARFEAQNLICKRVTLFLLCWTLSSFNYSRAHHPPDVTGISRQLCSLA